MSDNVSKDQMPEVNPRLLRILKAAEKMEKALESIKDHLVIMPFEFTRREKGPFDLSDDDRRVSTDSDILGNQIRARHNERMSHSLFYEFVMPTIKELECNDVGLSEEEIRRIIQSRMNVLIILQIETVDTNSNLLDEVNLAAFEVLKA